MRKPTPAAVTGPVLLFEGPAVWRQPSGASCGGLPDVAEYPFLLTLCLHPGAQECVANGATISERNVKQGNQMRGTAWAEELVR